MEYTAPETEEEEILCEAFEKALGMEHIGTTDNFISLGGDSLKATMVASYFNSRSRYHIMARDVLRKRIVTEILAISRSLADEKVRYNQKDGHRPTRSQADIGEYIIQMGWSFNVPVVTPMEAGIPAELIAGAFRKLVQYTPSLRTRFVEKDGKPWVMYDAEPEIRVVHEDPMVFKDTFVRRFDVYGKELMRVAIVEWQGETLIFMDLCHLIVDGESFSSLVKRLKMLMMGLEIPMDEGILRQAEYDHAYLKTPGYPKRVMQAVEMLKDCDDHLPDDPGSPDDPGLFEFALSMD